MAVLAGAGGENIPHQHLPDLPDLPTALEQEARRQTLSIQQGGKNWPMVETEFFIIRHQPLVEPNPIAVKKLDLFLAQTLDLLDTSETTIKEIRHHKLSYYLCDDATVARLTGYQTKGMADLAGRAVISSHFPHFHELAHLLVHLMQETPPMQTHPLVQEGIACLMGGRWGRAPATVLYTGWVHERFGMGKLDDVLTQADFFAFPGGPDVAYPLGALLCETVRRDAGWFGVVELNERLSGSAQKVASLTRENVVETIADICNWDKQDSLEILDRKMASVRVEYRRCGILPVTDSLQSLPVKKMSCLRGDVLAWEEGNRHYLKVIAEKFPVHLLSPKTSGDWGQSSLFEEHFPGRQYNGQHYGMRCCPDSISLYDYTTNQLIATWVAGFTDELDACGNGSGGLFFELADPFSPVWATFLADGSEIW